MQRSEGPLGFHSSQPFMLPLGGVVHLRASEYPAGVQCCTALNCVHLTANGSLVTGAARQATSAHQDSLWTRQLTSTEKEDPHLAFDNQNPQASHQVARSKLEAWHHLTIKC